MVAINLIFKITYLQGEAGQKLATIRGGGRSNFFLIPPELGELEKEK